MPKQPKIARVLFDESHSEAWTIRRDLAVEMQPSHPEDSSYAVAAEPLAPRFLEAFPTAELLFPRAPLAAAAVLANAHPPARKGEAPPTPPPPRLSDRELDAIEEF